MSLSEERQHPTPFGPSGKILALFEFQEVDAETQDRIQEMRNRFKAFAEELATALAPSAETTVALRKLLESKDAAVRSLL